MPLEDGIYPLLSLHAVLAGEFAADDDRLEMVTIAFDRQEFAGPLAEQVSMASGCIMGCQFLSL